MQLLSSGTCFIKSHDVITKVCATSSCHNLHSAHVFADLDADLTHLQGQFACRNDDQCWKNNNYNNINVKILISSKLKKYS